MSIENPTLVHFRHFRHFSSLLSIFPLYICRDTSTHVMSTLQIAPFLTNKANFLKSQINVTTCLTMNYDKMDTWSIRKKQSQTNPNKAKFKMGKINITIYITKGYENKSPFWVPKKQSQICPISHQRTMNDEQQTNNNQTQFQRQNYTGRDYRCDKSTVTLKKDNVNRNCFSINPLQTLRKYRQRPCVDFLQHRVLIHIRVVFVIVETKLKVYT